jgi:hypothetical protein
MHCKKNVINSEAQGIEAEIPQTPRPNLTYSMYVLRALLLRGGECGMGQVWAGGRGIEADSPVPACGVLQDPTGRDAPKNRRI